jgi:uncharacterized protein
MSDQPHTGNPGNFAEDRQKAVRAGRLGGQRSSGNFSRNRERAVEAGRKGGLKSHGGGGPRSRPEETERSEAASLAVESHSQASS